MRKCIFKKEISYEFARFGLDQSQSKGLDHEILNILFSDPYKANPQYLLKKEFENLGCISEALNKISIPNLNHEMKANFIGNIVSMFEMSDDLELPTKLREQLAGNEKLAIFVGSGVSKLIGFPLWSELAYNAIDHLNKKKILSYSEKERILTEPSSPKHKLSIFQKLLSKDPNEYQLFYKTIFESKKNIENNPYNLLARLDCLKVSINYDCSFWEALDNLKRSEKRDAGGDDTKYDEPELVDCITSDTRPEKTNAVYQIHGSYKKLNDYSIVTLSDYLDKYYRNQNSGPSSFLKDMFREFVTVFIGCGMEEFEIIQHLIGPRTKNAKHHMLVGTYLGDTNLLNMKKEYFGETLGINVHGYYLDSSGYFRLYEVLESWAKNIPEEQSGILKRISEADGIEL